MKALQKYASATAFRTALEDRLKKLAQLENIDLQRVRRQAAFDRLLCRLFANPNAPWLLKGGYAMELRLKTARTTRDIDLAVTQLPLPAAGSRRWSSRVFPRSISRLAAAASGLKSPKVCNNVAPLP